MIAFLALFLLIIAMSPVISYMLAATVHHMLLMVGFQPPDIMVLFAIMMAVTLIVHCHQNPGDLDQKRMGRFVQTSTGKKTVSTGDAVKLLMTRMAVIGFSCLLSIGMMSLALRVIG